jgi:antitoxin (DNA-binding transcriptional repressor) of toxin-antitoxin stability system
MKTLTMRDLNRKTATVLDAVERGEVFELRRNGKAIGYITHIPPAPQRKPDWKARFEWLSKQPGDQDTESLIVRRSCAASLLSSR